MYDEYCLWAQVAVLLMLGLYCTVWDRYMQVLYLGRAPRTKETLANFREKISGRPTFMSIPRVDGLSTDPRDFRLHSLVSELRYTNT